MNWFLIMIAPAVVLAGSVLLLFLWTGFGNFDIEND
ncbi:cytochrome bd oxidase small subunit CydS [Metabacillus lacus]